MNIATVLKTLKEKNLIPDNEEGISLFSDCFNKFGISILLLKDQEKFNQIVDLLVENQILLQKANGMYCLRIFAVEYNELKNIIDEYAAINEIPFLRKYPEIIAEAKTVHTIAENMKKYQDLNLSYKNGDNYDINKLLSEEIEEKQDDSVNEFLKSQLKDGTLLDNLINEISNGENSFDVNLDLEKVENKIKDEFLVPNGEAWDVCIDGKKINSYDEVKNTLETMQKLNLPCTYEDALLLALFYKTNLTVEEIKNSIYSILNEGGEA